MIRASLTVGGLVLLIAFGAHAGFHVWQEQQLATHWVAVGSTQTGQAWRHYLERKDYYLGYSYALAAGFTAFALTLAVLQRRHRAGGVLGGLTMLGVLYAAGCFLIGCCGSPMLAVYLSLFGARVLGFLKPLVAVITTLSVVASGVVLARRSRNACCDKCEPSAAPRG